MKIKVAASNPVFPQFVSGEEVIMSIKYDDDNFHIITHTDKSYVFEIKKTIILSKDKICVSGFLLDEEKGDFGLMAFEFSI
jgi:hypothetical protein